MEYTITTSSSSATIDSFGAQLISLQDVLGNEYVWQRDPAFWPRSAPILFPVVGGLREDKTQIESGEYTMARHGFAKESEFEIYEQGKSTICLVLRSNDETRKQYPYDFELYVRFNLLGDGLVTQYSVRCTDHREMVFCIGGHPGFCCPLRDGDEFSDYELRFECPESVPVPDYVDGIIDYAHTRDLLGGRDVLPLEYSLFDHDAIIFDGLKSRRIKLVSRRSCRGLQFDFADFSTVAFWTPPGKHARFLCFEPWFGMGARNDDVSQRLEDKKGAIRLASGAVFTAKYEARFI